MKDLFGNDLNLGDIVGFNPPSYKGLTKGKIDKFTPKGVKVLHYNAIYKELQSAFIYSHDCVKALPQASVSN